MVNTLFSHRLNFLNNSFNNFFTDFFNNFLMGIKEIFSDKPCSLLSFNTLWEALIILFVLPTLVFFVISFSYRLYRLIFCKNTTHAYVVKGVSLTWSIALYPLICLSKHGYALRDTDTKKYLTNHELIHIHQQHETFVIFGYLVYGIEYLVRLIIFRNRYKAYRSLSMEAEAYINQNNLHYLENRRSFAWVKYLFTKNL